MIFSGFPVCQQLFQISPPPPLCRFVFPAQIPPSPPLHEANGGTRPSPAKTDRQRRDNPRLLRDYRLSFLPSFLPSFLSFFRTSPSSYSFSSRGLENAHSIFLFLRATWHLRPLDQSVSFLDRDRERRCEEVAARELLAGAEERFHLDIGLQCRFLGLCIQSGDNRG